MASPTSRHARIAALTAAALVAAACSGPFVVESDRVTHNGDDYRVRASGNLEVTKLEAPTSTPAATLVATPIPTATTGPPTPTTVPPTPTAQPPVSGQACPQSVHDSYTTVYDGDTYPTWHPQVDKSGCHFLHEHGNDPALFDDDFRPPYGIAVAHHPGHAEPHPGFKTYVMETETRDGRSWNGYRWMLSHHFGTASTARVCNRHHEYQLAVKRLSDDKIVADLKFLADFGKATVQDTDAVFAPPECPNQGDVGSSNGVRQIRTYNPSDPTGYEPWRPDLGGLLVGVTPFTINTPSGIVIPLSRTDLSPRPFSTRIPGTMRFVTYSPTATAPKGNLTHTFWSDPFLKVVRPTGDGVKQYIEPGVSLLPKERVSSEECIWDARRPYSSQVVVTDPERLPMICVNDQQQAAIGKSVNLTQDINKGKIVAPN